ncbi:EI24 domain-containing protein [Peredibacter sp. HCB2-198]|uniref:EI24 domain-containing protein n=1 Tax=Peredibacter sp. HCB2-198 TaxID=3383025 RepID=UPI0038B4BC7B
MKGILKAFPMAFKMILTDPVNFVLSIFPTVIALALYIFTIVSAYRNSDRLVAFFRGYIYTSDQATFLATLVTGILMIFIFFVMSWTFVIVVGIIAAPFNSLLSSRIETKLVQKVYMDEDQSKALEQVKMSMGQTFKNEAKKLVFIGIVAVMAFLLNLFPLFYPLGVFLVATLVAVQFVDYSWSRRNMHFGECFKDVLKNIIPYSISGAIFLLLVAIPIVNAFIPALATSYFTVLFLYRQKKIELAP